jgi:hypothetical protein
VRARRTAHAIYEEDFLGFSYAFRPRRSQHDALDALAVGIGSRKVNWILDADIAAFFDTVSHEWLIRFVEHRIGDQCAIRLIRKWLKAGVLEDNKIEIPETGTPQGAVISPLLANIYPLPNHSMTLKSLWSLRSHPPMIASGMSQTIAPRGSQVRLILVDSLKVLDPEWPIREADIGRNVRRGFRSIGAAAGLCLLPAT